MVRRAPRLVESEYSEGTSFYVLLFPPYALHVLMCYRLKMEKVVNLKFTQHPSLKEELLATGEAPLVEVRKPPFVPLQPQ